MLLVKLAKREVSKEIYEFDFTAFFIYAIEDYTWCISFSVRDKGFTTLSSKSKRSYSNFLLSIYVINCLFASK